MLQHNKDNKYKFIKILKGIRYEKLSCLDIGGSENSINALIKNTKVLDVKNADIKFNLLDDFIIKKRLPLKNNSFDLVVISQIIEHTVNAKEIFNEAKRITKKYIILGLPNDLTIDNRIRLLLGKLSGFTPFGHKQILNYNDINEFLEKNKGKDFRVINNFNLFASKGGRYLPTFLKEVLAKFVPTLFCKERFWLLEKTK